MHGDAGERSASGNGFNMAQIIHDFLCYNIPVTRNLADLLEKSLDSTRRNLIHRVADESSALGFPLYIVGGFVRDLMLGRDGTDFDLVVEGDAIRLARVLASKYGGTVTIHDKFRTAKWILKDSILDTRKPVLSKAETSNIEDRISNIGFLDLISSRSETYSHPAALPTVKMGSLADDLRRRDFTINTLALRLDGERFGELRDDLGGLGDLQKGIVRVLHPRSFVDDPTRMYRAVRYERRYGFKIADETLALIPEARPLVEKLSAQRIRRELDLILDEPKAASMLTRLNALDLLKPIHPALHWDKSTYKRIVTLSEAKGLELSNIEYRLLRWMLWLVDLSGREIESLNKRLHFTAALLDSLKASSKLLSDLSSFADLKPSQCVERLDKIPLPAAYAVSLAARGRPKQKLEKYISEWRHVKPHTTGHDLKKLGLEPGPKYQKILWRLRAAWLDGEIKASKDENGLLEKLFLHK